MLTVKDLQAKYGVTRQSIENWRKLHNLPTIKIAHAVFFDEQAVEEWYRKYKTKK